MALKDIKNLEDLRRERGRLETEKKLATHGFKTNLRTQYNIVKVKSRVATDQIAYGIAATEQKIKGNWKLPALGGLGAMLGVFLVSLFSFNNEQEVDEQEMKTNEVAGGENEIPANATDHDHVPPDRLEDRIKAAMAEYEAEKEMEGPSAFSIVLSAIGPLLLREALRSDWIRELLGKAVPYTVNTEMQQFSDRVADELEELKETLT